MSSFLERAAPLLADGWHVFPCQPNGKFPLTPNGHLAATNDPLQVLEWAADFPNANVALVPGKSGHVVLDVDTKKGHDGLAALATLDPALAMSLATGEGRIVETPSGGWHIYMRKEPGEAFPNINGSALGDGLDLRDCDGYVLAPGSVADGKPYREIGDGCTARRPDWLPEKLASYVRPERTEAVREATPVRLSILLEMLRAVSADCSRDEWRNVGMALRSAVIEGMPEGRTAFELWDAWSATAPHRYPEGGSDALRYQWDSFDETPREGHVGIGTLAAYARLGGWAGNLAPRPADPFAEFIGQPTAAPVAEPDDDLSDVRIGADHDLDKIAEPEWLVSGLIEERSLGRIVGQPGSRKTFLALDLCLRIAHGEEWVPGHAADRPTKVLYVAGEGFSGLPARIAAWMRQHKGATNKAVPREFMSTDRLPRLSSPDEWAAFLRRVRKLRPELVVFDTQSRLTGAAGYDENSAQDMGALVARMADVQAAGAAVLLIHHPSRNGLAGRGSNIVDGALDWELFVSKDEGTATVKMTKMRSAAEWATEKRFSLRPVVFDLNRGDAGTGAAIVPEETGGISRRAAADVAAEQERIRRAALQARDAQLIEKVLRSRVGLKDHQVVANTQRMAELVVEAEELTIGPNDRDTRINNTARRLGRVKAIAEGAKGRPVPASALFDPVRGGWCLPLTPAGA